VAAGLDERRGVRAAVLPGGLRIQHRARQPEHQPPAYEHGRKSPTVATFSRLLSEAGCELTTIPHVTFTQQLTSRGRPVWVPDHLPRLDVADAFARGQLPLHLNWSAPGRVFDLGSRADRARVYEIVLQEGRPADILAYVDGALLLDLWADLVLPQAIRSAWAPVIQASR